MNLIKRILSGVIYIALIVAAILLLDNSPVMYLLVFPLLIVLDIGEMITMAKDDATQSSTSKHFRKKMYILQLIYL